MHLLKTMNNDDNNNSNTKSCTAMVLFVSVDNSQITVLIF